MKHEKNDAGALVLVEMTPGLTEIAHEGSTRLAVPGQIVAASLWIHNGTELQELRFRNCDGRFEAEHFSSPELKQLPIQFDCPAEQ